MVHRDDHQPEWGFGPLSNPVSGTRHRSPIRSSLSEPDTLELHEIQTHEENDDEEVSGASISSGEYRITTRRTVSRTSRCSSEESKGLWGRVKRFWTRNVVLTVPQKSNRDHFALERTFLAYIRTSVMIAMQGVLIALLFRLQRRTAQPKKGPGFYEIGIPLSIAYHSVALLVALIGANRFWRQQHAIGLGKVHVGGWELNVIGFLIAALLISTLILTVYAIINIDKRPL
ncbi:hypothetical protein ASPWEDRAFT_688999 [Aspergillus wentii DTO 134E9]|uniref:DUF202 domain-containing protein n=1 Tax=Aspergillus wentii DTO 134E9 TaxID=1073089 RepID=A0A1L9R8Q2_ASPWE|nr:uncharacterized protein ASPWEDRAFT_688999 [Aspergillus wentii DTO 134E9]OJJ31237.1 hypothetical protein ASPWEDRAFT_688999 [Aspergillus wentii DTO 134E9]